MPIRESAPAGAPCWVDLMSSDPDKSKDFYAQLFGWTYQDSGEEYGGYVQAFKDGRTVAGLVKNNGAAGMPDVWSTYLLVPDAQAAADAVSAHGGQVLMTPLQVGGMGSMAIFLDPGQAAIGGWEPGLHQGYERVAEAGAPCWHEVLTRDYDQTVAFYRDVFGWDTSVMSDTPEFRYTTLGEGDDALAGIMDASAFLPAGVPPMWITYWGSADVDAAVAKTLELGGTVVRGAEDTPFGRVADLTDVTGANFKIISA